MFHCDVTTRGGQAGGRREDDTEGDGRQGLRPRVSVVRAGAEAGKPASFEVCRPGFYFLIKKKFYKIKIIDHILISSL